MTVNLKAIEEINCCHVSSDNRADRDSIIKDSTETLEQTEVESNKQPSKINRSTMIFALCAAVNSVNIGFDMGVNTTAVPIIKDELNLSDVQTELLIGSLGFWSLFGSLFSYWVCDKFGRRRSFDVAAVSVIIGLIIMSSSHQYVQLMIGRLFVGLGVGFGLAIDPLYIAEIAPAEHRGRLSCWSEFAINIGILLGFIAGIIFYPVVDHLSWRLMLLVGCILPSVMLVLTRTVMPESPRWLVGKHREDEAKQVLQRIYGEDNDDIVETVTQEIRETLELEKKADEIGWKAIFCPSPAVFRMLLCGLGTAIAQPATGIEVILYYALAILENSGLTNELARLGVLIVLGLVKTSFIVLGGYLLDKIGRRKSFFISYAGMCAALLMIGFDFIFGGSSPAVPIIALVIFMSFFSIASGPGAWLVPSEVFSNTIRARAMSLTSFSNRLVGSIMSSTFLSTVAVVGWGGFFLMMAGACVVVIIYLFWLLPETNGRSIEDMTIFFANLTGDTKILDAEAMLVENRTGKKSGEVV